MTPQHAIPARTADAHLPAPPRSGSREIVEVGPTTGAISLPVGPRLVFVSADGSWGHPAD